MIYGTRSNGGQHGLVITKPEVVEKMLYLVDYHPSRDLRSTKVIEPSAGDGAFAIPLIEALHISSVHHNFDFQSSLMNLRFFEIDSHMFEQLSLQVSKTLELLGYQLPSGILIKDDFLMAEIGKVDVVIGNPPYVRHENIPEDKKNTYRRLFGTFSHRSDLFIAFFGQTVLFEPNKRLTYGTE